MSGFLQAGGVLAAWLPVVAVVVGTVLWARAVGARAARTALEVAYARRRSAEAGAASTLHRWLPYAAASLGLPPPTLTDPEATQALARAYGGRHGHALRATAVFVEVVRQTVTSQGAMEATSTYDVVGDFGSWLYPRLRQLVVGEGDHPQPRSWDVVDVGAWRGGIATVVTRFLVETATAEDTVTPGHRFVTEILSRPRRVYLVDPVFRTPADAAGAADPFPQDAVEATCHRLWEKQARNASEGEQQRDAWDLWRRIVDGTRRRFWPVATGATFTPETWQTLRPAGAPFPGVVWIDTTPAWSSLAPCLRTVRDAASQSTDTSGTTHAFVVLVMPDMRTGVGMTRFLQVWTHLVAVAAPAKVYTRTREWHEGGTALLTALRRVAFLSEAAATRQPLPAVAAAWPVFQDLSFPANEEEATWWMAAADELPVVAEFLL